MKQSRQVSVAEAKKHFSELLGTVRYGGETIVITKRGCPIARLTPFEDDSKGCFPSWPGWLSDDDPFFAVMDEIVAARGEHRPRILP